MGCLMKLHLCRFAEVLQRISYFNNIRFSYLSVFVSLLKGLLRVRVRVWRMAL